MDLLRALESVKGAQVLYIAIFGSCFGKNPNLPESMPPLQENSLHGLAIRAALGGKAAVESILRDNLPNVPSSGSQQGQVCAKPIVSLSSLATTCG